MSMRAHHARVVLWIALCVPLSLGAALYFGSVHLHADEWLRLLRGSADENARQIIWHLRAPRAFAAFACGALLALAGALLQVLLRNPLADPYLLGVSGGASVGALLAMFWNLGTGSVQLAALIGACLAAGALFRFALKASGWQIHRVILAGVALAAGFAAIVAMILSLAPAGRLRGMLFWLMGDLSGVEYVWPAWLVLLIVGAVALSQAARLDALMLGPLKAASLGVPIRLTQSLAFIAATVATVAAVLLAGAVGFVGLVVPHLLRLAGVNHHRLLLPLSAIAGGALLTCADTLARSVAAPLEFPVGAMTALIGVPVLFYLLWKQI